jgi:hypothetical protein
MPVLRFAVVTVELMVELCQAIRYGSKPKG